MSRTANASGSLAAPWMGGRNGPSNTKPRAGAVVCIPQPGTGAATSAVTVVPERRRSSIIAWPSSALVCWGR